MGDPYDELPYRARPIEWTAPERLALASALHGGPRLPTSGYRVLDLGCADGSNLLPMAWYRRHAQFVGLDSSARQIATANEHRDTLGLDNLRFVHGDFERGRELLREPFDIIICHGVLSWVDDDSRRQLLALCAEKLRPGGLLYLNYNTKPGWAIRGMVREYLVGQTAGIGSLTERVEAARHASARFVAGMEHDESPHPYRALMKNELTLVRDAEASYLAHEYLAGQNHAFWRSELLALAESFGLAHVAEADFNHPWERTDDDFMQWLAEEKLTGVDARDTSDWLAYRQLHSPLLTLAPYEPQPLRIEELAELYVASVMTPADDPTDDPDQPKGEHRFAHPNGQTINVTTASFARALHTLVHQWPKATRVGDLFDDDSDVLDDLVLLYRNGLVDLRVVEPAQPDTPDEALARHERAWGGYATDPLHRWRPVEAPEPESPGASPDEA